RLRLTASPLVVRAPTVVTLNGARAAVTPEGTVRFATPVRSARFTLEILRAEFPGGTPRRLRHRDAVAIAELDGGGLRLSVPRAGAIHAPCGSAALRAGRTQLPLRASGDVAAFDLGRPLEARGCSGLDLSATPVALRGVP